VEDKENLKEEISLILQMKNKKLLRKLNSLLKKPNPKRKKEKSKKNL